MKEETYDREQEQLYRQSDRTDQETGDGEGLCGPGPERGKVDSLYTWLGRVVVTSVLER